MVFEPLATASAIFKLGDLEEAKHDSAWVLWEFRELVVVSADRSEVILLVAAID